MWKTFSESTELWIHMLTLACHFSSCWFSIKSCRRLISAVIPLTRNWPVDTFILTHSVYSKKQAKSPVFTPRSRLASDLQIPCLAKVALSGLRQGDGATEKFSEGSRARGMRGCKDEEGQIKMRGREGRMVKKKKGAGERVQRSKSWWDIFALYPPSSPRAFLVPLPLPSLIEPLRLNSSGIHKVASPTPTCLAFSCHGWNERLRSFVDQCPCHILSQHCLPLQLGVVEIKWGTGFWSLFPPLSPPVMHVFLWQS